MKPTCIDIRARLAAVLMATALVACGGGDDHFVTGPRQVNPAVSVLLDSVDAIGPGGTGLLSNQPARADLALQSNRAGATVQLRFSCVRCDISVSAAGSTVGANQYIAIPFATLEASADVPVLVTDRISGAQATYTLHARPADHPRYTVGVQNNPAAGDLYLSPFDPTGFAAPYA